MTSKDFQLIARTIHAMPSHSPSLRTARESCARAFADALATTNPAFKRDQFLKACGVES